MAAKKKPAEGRTVFPWTDTAADEQLRREYIDLHGVSEISGLSLSRLTVAIHNKRRLAEATTEETANLPTDTLSDLLPAPLNSRPIGVLFRRADIEKVLPELTTPRRPGPKPGSKNKPAAD